MRLPPPPPTLVWCAIPSLRATEIFMSRVNIREMQKEREQWRRFSPTKRFFLTRLRRQNYLRARGATEHHAFIFQEHTAAVIAGESEQEANHVQHDTPHSPLLWRCCCCYGYRLCYWITEWSHYICVSSQWVVSTWVLKVREMTSTKNMGAEAHWNHLKEYFLRCSFIDIDGLSHFKNLCLCDFLPVGAVCTLFRFFKQVSLLSC